MLRSGTPGSVTTVTDVPEEQNERSVRRLRLTLHPGESSTGQRNIRGKTTHTDGKVNGTWEKRNGFIRERPAGRESPVNLEEQRGGGGALTNGAPREAGPGPGGGPKVYGVVRRSGDAAEQEVMAREWSVNHLQDEMKYIREVRDSLEKVREKMYGQFGGMQQSVERLSREIKAANSHRRTLEREVQVRTVAMESFDQMNSNLISANLNLQKSLLESCQTRVCAREELRSVKGSQGRVQDTLRERERQLATAQEENRTLKHQVEVSQEALRELSSRLQQQHEQRLQEEQSKHRQEIQTLQAQIDMYVKRIEELERNARVAEAKMADRDQRIQELQRLLDCMGVEKDHLAQKLRDTEQRLQQLDHMDRRDPAVTQREEQLQEEASELRERIKHLNDMVFCQQRKVKGMIEEVEHLRSKVAQKDMFISELLDRLAIVECENNELEDKLRYYLSVQSTSETDRPSTRDIGVGCNLPALRSDPPPPPPQPQQQQQQQQSHRSSPAPAPAPAPASLPRTSRPTRLSPTRPGPIPAPSRMSSTLLRFSPVQYSQYLQNLPPVPRDEADSSGPSSRSDSSVQTTLSLSPSSLDFPSLTYSPIARTAPPQLNTPFMRLMDISSKINID
ncbi:hypothetical protein ACEWY4_026529 [Coilia grayii]|uniref:Myocardial zonula adherens protein n=1 Tax=Coilia grayii TaxID=363190 RepID=A0ABD1ISU2_9TELE